MILVSFFFSHRALSKNLSRNGTALKVTKFGGTNRQTDISRLILKDTQNSRFTSIKVVFSEMPSCGFLKIQI